jgi:hypothetical protein
VRNEAAHHPPRPTFRNSFQSRTLSPPTSGAAARHRHSHSMTLSRSQDGYSRALSRSPERTSHKPSNVITVDRRQSVDQDIDEGDSDTDHSRPLTSPPLLMAPPTTFFGDIRYRASLLLHRASQDIDSLGTIARLALFLVKMATLQQVCWPYSVARLVGACLFTAAAAELVVPWAGEGPNSSGPRMSLPSKGETIDSGFPEDDEGERSDRQGTLASSPEVRPGISRHSSGRRTREVSWRGSREARVWDWRVGLFLLALHCLILGVTSRYGALCAVPDGEKWLRR